MDLSFNFTVITILAAYTENDFISKDELDTLLFPFVFRVMNPINPINCIII